MGHQVNFFLDIDDTMRVEALARSIAPLVVLHSRSGQAAPRVVENVLLDEHGRRWLSYYLVQPECLGDVRMEYVPRQGCWTVDDFRSPVVQFDTCFCDGVILRRGRLYYVDGYYDSQDNWVYYPDSFRKWAKTLLAKTRKILTRHDILAYIGPGAKAWLETSGGKLSDM